MFSVREHQAVFPMQSVLRNSVAVIGDEGDSRCSLTSAAAAIQGRRPLGSGYFSGLLM